MSFRFLGNDALTVLLNKIKALADTKSNVGHRHSYTDIGLSEEEWHQMYVEEMETFLSDTKQYTELFTTQQKAFFVDWFADLQYILDGDVAGHLQNQIDALATGPSAVSEKVIFNADGSIEERFTAGGKKLTVFNADGSITETTYSADGKAVQTVQTVFNADGSISITVS